MPVTIELPSGRRVVLDKSTILVGSAVECDLRLPECQPQHAKIRKLANRWLVESQGDWLIRVADAAAAKSCWIQPGDLIHLSPQGPLIEFVRTSPEMATIGSPVALGRHSTHPPSALPHQTQPLLPIAKAVSLDNWPQVAGPHPGRQTKALRRSRSAIRRRSLVGAVICIVAVGYVGLRRTNVLQQLTAPSPSIDSFTIPRFAAMASSDPAKTKSYVGRRIIIGGRISHVSLNGQSASKFVILVLSNRGSDDFVKCKMRDLGTYKTLAKSDVKVASVEGAVERGSWFPAKGLELTLRDCVICEGDVVDLSNEARPMGSADYERGYEIGLAEARRGEPLFRHKHQFAIDRYLGWVREVEKLTATYGEDHPTAQLYLGIRDGFRVGLQELGIESP